MKRRATENARQGREEVAIAHLERQLWTAVPRPTFFARGSTPDERKRRAPTERCERREDSCRDERSLCETVGKRVGWKEGFPWWDGDLPPDDGRRAPESAW